MKWVILVGGVICNASASILVKVAMMRFGATSPLSNARALVLNWPLWVGVILYGFAFILYAAALARLPLNIAHPILTSGAIALVALSSVTVFREPFYWTTGGGILLIMIGVTVLTIRAP